MRTCSANIFLLHSDSIVPHTCITALPRFFIRHLLPNRYTTLFFLFSPLTLIAYPAHSCHRRSVFQTQIWTDALVSVALKCFSRKILPFCERERVIFQKKRRKQLVRQYL